MVTLDFIVFCFFKQKTAYELRMSDWSSDVCSSDLHCVDQSSAVPNSPPRRLARSLSSVSQKGLRIVASAWALSVNSASKGTARFVALSHTSASNVSLPCAPPV